MRKDHSTDYDTYREIMGELIKPIDPAGLDLDTLKRLYESKLVYLENLRVKCFYEINRPRPVHFTVEDYELILRAVRETNRHMRELIIYAMHTNMDKRQTG